MWIDVRISGQRQWLGVLAVVLLAGCGGGTPLSLVRAQADGSTATVEGYVTVAPGAFESAMGNPGFALQDDTGGIYVKLAEKLGFGLGARVRVTGTLAQEAQFRVLQSDMASVETLAGTREVTPVAKSTGGVNESTEGQLVKVTAKVTQTFQDDSPYGYKLYVNDGSGEVQVFVHVSAGFSKSTLEALTLDQTIEVVGLSAQYETTYEVAPRKPADLVVP